MGRRKQPPDGFACEFAGYCPYLEGLSTQWVFSEYQRAHQQEHEHWRIREAMAEEIDQLQRTLNEQAALIDELRAQNRRLHQRGFKASKKKKPSPPSGKPPVDEKKRKKKRGAPKGHPGWTRKVPDRVDRTIEIDAPCRCPHCQEKTDTGRTDTTSFIQEDIVLRPQTVVTEYIHTTAWCPTCRRQVIRKLEDQLPFAPIGPQAKAAALYLRHELKLPYRKIQQLMSDLFGLDFVAASSLGFEKRARHTATPVYEQLIEKLRSSELVHADETYWREDGVNHFVWYAGNQDLALFHIDAHRSTEAAKVLLGERIDGLLVTDAYAAYNAIEVLARQSCLAHLLRKADELTNELSLMEKPDPQSIRFCAKLTELFTFACRKTIPAAQKAKSSLVSQLRRVLDLICETPLAFPKAETLRKRLIPGARERDEVFAFIQHHGPPTNNHAERALRPLVIFRKVSMGSRSSHGSENISIFSSLTQTAKLQNASALDLFKALLVGSPADAHDVIFDDSS